MTSTLICIPHLSGREKYLVNCIRGIAERTDSPWNIALVRDAPSAGEGWNQCAEQLGDYPETTHIAFFNDDIVPATGWLPPLIEADGYIPGVRVEPAGGHCDPSLCWPPMPPDTFPVPRDWMSYYYADHPDRQPRVDLAEIPHSNLPFCTVEMWREIGPFPPFHYGSDCWFSAKAREHGWPTLARMDSVVYNYNCGSGRSKGDWTEQDFLDFDGIFALPAYLSGELAQDEPHPLRLTDEGLRKTREWRRQHLANGG